eukprot:471099-Pelagomonas_calceolata.AAC.3
MADESAIKRAALLRHFLGLFGKEKDAALEAGACREACHALTSQQLLRETQLMHASSHARGQLAQSVEAWCSSLGKLLQKAQPSPLVAMLLSTTIQTCDADRLLQVHGAWGTALADILKKCSTSLTPQGAATPQPSSAAALVVAVSAALRHLFTRCAVLIIIAQISPGQFKAVPGALGWLATIGLFSISCRNWKYTS